MLHRISLDEGEVVECLDFEQRIKSVFILLVVTTSDHVQLTLWSIDALEIVWERCLVSQSCDLGSLIHEINGIKCLGILLEQMDQIDWWPAVTVSATKA